MNCTLHAVEAIRAMGLDAFIAKYSLHATRDGGLVSLKYNQIESPMHEPCVADCRGLVVRESDPTEVVAMAYRKFWNAGEKYADRIDWSTARVMEKLDGSLMTMYWDSTHDEWRVASSGHPTAGGSYNQIGEDKKFRDAFWETFYALGYKLPPLCDRDFWFIFELCRPDNRIVVRYTEQRLVLHGARSRLDFAELGHHWLSQVGADYDWEVVKSWPIREHWHHDAVIELAASTDPLDLEGFVVVDDAFRRIKVKNPRYVEIHHLRGNRSPRSVIELWKAGEVDEVLAHFPEMRADFEAVTTRLNEATRVAAERWAATRDIPLRKDFAAAVKDTPFAGVLFRLYTDKPDGDPMELVSRGVNGMNTQAILRALALE